MVWSAMVTAMASALAALLGVFYGARLTAHRESANWTREQRLKAYADLLHAINKSHGAFTLIAASLELNGYSSSSREDPKIRAAMKEWNDGEHEIDKSLPLVELVVSKHMRPRVIGGIKHGFRTRMAALLMQLDYTKKVDREEWKSASSYAHQAMIELPEMLHDDIYRIDRVQSRSQIAATRLRHRLVHRFSKILGRSRRQR